MLLPDDVLQDRKREKQPDRASKGADCCDILNTYNILHDSSRSEGKQAKSPLKVFEFEFCLMHPCEERQNLSLNS